MQFQLRKEILEPRYMAGYGQLASCAMYIVSQHDKKIGQFFYSDEVSFYAYGEEDVRIDYIRRFLRQTLFPIIDQKTQQTIGKYDQRERWISFSSYARLFLGESLYLTKKIDKRNVGTGSSHADKLDIWVGNIAASVNYRLSIPQTGNWFGNTYVNNRPLEGTVDLQGGNLQLLFCSLFLVKQVLYLEDSD